MARCRSETESETSHETAGPTIEDAARRFGVESATAVARAALERAGEPAIDRFGRGATVLAAVRLASRRTDGPTIGVRDLSDAFGVGRDPIVGAEEVLATTLSPPADPDETRTLRRRLVVAHEIRTACESGRPRPELPGSYLADAAPDLLARVDGLAGHPEDLEDRDDIEASTLEEALQAHIDRLEADLELARLGTTLYAAVEEVR
ncbi:hypothetical protein [Halobiforma nitratireducens]|uniref:Uncharacterized protein n=1 Tax=Halobiforma nitratireducens JCM 10879 TaxID=1227454 RepID=M0M5S9_9EURY|nr:hypothetical protein [Halobiforma nitratireducens]EMA41167.1 hypothetical protein C446_06405 [Halobiforma nitratireducens JCM 10879]